MKNDQKMEPFIGHLALLTFRIVRADWFRFLWLTFFFVSRTKLPVNVAGESKNLEPSGADVLGINIPFGEYLNAGSFDTTYVDESIRISRSKTGPVDQLRLFVKAVESTTEEEEVVEEDDDLDDDEIVDDDDDDDDDELAEDSEETPIDAEIVDEDDDDDDEVVEPPSDIE